MSLISTCDECGVLIPKEEAFTALAGGGFVTLCEDCLDAIWDDYEDGDDD